MWGLSPRKIGVGRKKPGALARCPASVVDQEALAGRFIWQLVGVLETYGSICLIGTKV